MAGAPRGPSGGRAVPVSLRRGPPVPEWPHRLLDVDELISSGWRRQPFRQFVLKIHGRCNLACDYCYVYRSPDQTWRRRPARMSPTTMARAADRIAEHARSHALNAVEVVLHGGEPLLFGRQGVDRLATTLRDAMPRGTSLSLAVQTNGTLLDRGWLEIFDRHDIRVGVSLDGPPSTHDLRRTDHTGSGSHAAAARGIDLLRTSPHRRLYSGLLAVIDVWSDPVDTYEHLLRFEPPTIDLLLPHANWVNRPPGGPGGTDAPYGEWLVAVFDRWYSARERATSVRLFDEIIRMTFGRPSRLETIGLSPACLVVVETDGAIEHVDALKSAYHGAASTGLNVDDDSFDSALTDPQVVARQLGLAGLGPACAQCGIRAVCGGGYYPHRYHLRTGFLNRSVYCDDLARLITHVHARVSADVAASGAQPAG